MRDIKAPLADRMRPRTLGEFVGQGHLLSPGTLLRRAIDEDRLFSMILWGPPGSGKTTLARIIAHETKARFVSLSAVLSGVKELKTVIEEAIEYRDTFHQRTILFVDEVHRFNKAQQDAFLPHVESGLITLIGATTENPSFEIIAPLLSRCHVFVLYPYSNDELRVILERALRDVERGLGREGYEIDEGAVELIIWTADGDARMVLNSLEAAASLVDKREKVITRSLVEKALSKKPLLYDKKGEEHYNLISAFHKSLRGGDPDAAIYWMTRMLMAGEDPFYIARRMVRFAAEDVGLADPNALTVAMNAMEAYRFLGSPEGDLALVEACVYLATAPKSNALYLAYGRVRKLVEETGALPVPLHLRNAPTDLMKNLGYGKGYLYPHDFDGAVVDQKYLPEAIKEGEFYTPTDRGYEREIAERLDHWCTLRKKKSGKNG
jgi:putative ATPase